jgi:pyruvate dehydrogenase E2 component (dihydrolipoamide acetyltransferase)
MNAMLDDEHEEIILKKYYNIGIAADTPDGLIVPVIKGADQKDIYQLAREIESLARRAQERKIDLADLKGGTFTITNIGVLGGIHATPIINYPEVAILATGRVRDKLVLKGGIPRTRKVLPLSLSFDHRVADGAEAARFVNKIIMYLENPDMLLAE